MLVIHYKLDYNISRIISQNVLFFVYSLTSYQMKLEPKILEKICAAVAGSRNYDKQNTEKVLQLKDVFLVYL